MSAQFFAASYDFDAALEAERLNPSSQTGSINSLAATNSDGDLGTATFADSTQGYFIDDYQSGDYISFEIQALNPANTLNLTYLAFSHTRFAVNQGATSFAVRSNIDNYVSDITTGTVEATSNMVLLNSLVLTTAADTLTLRFYAFGVSGEGANTNFNGFGLDSVTIGGDVVPEVSQYSLLAGLSALVFLIARRKRAR